MDHNNEEASQFFPLLKAQLKKIEDIEFMISDEIEEKKELIVKEHYTKCLQNNCDEKWQFFQDFVKRVGEKEFRDVSYRMLESKPEELYGKLMICILDKDYDKFRHLYSGVFEREYKKTYPDKAAVINDVEDKLASMEESIIGDLTKIAGKTFPIIGFEVVEGHEIVKLFCPVLSKDHNDDYVLDLYTGPVERIPEDLIIRVERKIVEQIGLEVAK